VAVATTNTTVAGNTVSSERAALERLADAAGRHEGPLPHPSGFMFGFYGERRSTSRRRSSPTPTRSPIRSRSDYDIVGVKIVGTTIVVGTKGNPYTYTGRILSRWPRPAGKVEQALAVPLEAGMVNLGFGVAYAGAAGPRAHRARRRRSHHARPLHAGGMAALDPSTFIARNTPGRYVVSYSVGRRAAPDPHHRQVAEFAAVAANKNVQALWGDPTTGKLYVVVNDLIWQWDADIGPADARRLALARMGVSRARQPRRRQGGRRIQHDGGGERGAGGVRRDQGRERRAHRRLGTRGSLNGASLNTYSLNGSALTPLPPVNFDSLTFQIFTDGKLRGSHTVTNSRAFGCRPDTSRTTRRFASRGTSR
jgi:hypothetical protein